MTSVLGSTETMSVRSRNACSFSSRSRISCLSVSTCVPIELEARPTEVERASIPHEM